jgi:photosystem II stability/assembly factor-like uncharacterized protein
MKNSLLYITFLVIQTLLYQNNIQSQTQWEPLGPFGGKVRFLVSDGKEWVYSGIEGSGVFRSSNEGRKWEPINNGLSGDELYSFCIAPDGRIFCGGENILAVSTDHGNQWNLISTIPSNNRIKNILVLPNSNIFLTFGNNIFNNIPVRSTDNGVTWRNINGIPVWGGDITKIERGSDTTVIVGTDGQGIFQINPNVDTVVSLIYNLLKADRGSCPYYECSGFIVLEDGTILLPYFYALRTLSPQTKQWVRTPSSFSPSFLFVAKDSLIYGYYGSPLVVSSDFGKTWNDVSPSFKELFYTRNFTKINNSILSAWVSEIWRSEDNGKNWNLSVYGIVRSDINCVLVTSMNTVVIGTAQSSLFRSTDLGGNWTNILFPPPGGSGDYIVSVKSNSKNVLFAASMGATNSIWQSTTDGESWSQTAFNDSNITHGVALVITDMTINSQDEIFVSGFTRFQDSLSGVFKSTNGGNTWMRVFTVPNNTAARSFLIMDDSLVIMGTISNGFFRTTDLGVKWISINGTNNINQIVSIVQDSGSIILAGSLGSGIMRSTDKGITWNQANVGLTNFVVRTISKLPNGMLFAGTEKGGFVSQDHGLSWMGVTTSVPFGIIRSVFVNSDGSIYLATDGGIYKTFSITSVHKTTNPILPSEIFLSQNYPNPFNPVTMIRYQLTSNNYTTIKVYDVIGREVTTLVNEIKEAGSYSVIFNASSLPSGIYFYSIRSGNYKMTKTMSLLK